MSLIKGGLLDRRGFLKTTVAASVAASLPLNSARAAKRGGHVRCGKGHGQTTDTLNPGTYENGFTIDMAHGIHGYLVEVAPDGKMIPSVAESWEASDDASEWRFKLRKGVTFHSGKEVTVEDVIASVNFHRGEGSTSAAGPLVASITEIKAEGDDTIAFFLDGGNADFPFTVSDYHIPILKADGDSVDWQSGDGCGAYKIESLDFGVQASFSRYDGYFGEDGYFDSIEMLALVDLNARTTALVSGDVNIIDRLDLKTVGLLARKPGVNIKSVAGNAHYTIPMDTRIAPFNDNNVRQALKYGINREELVDKILFGYGSPGNDHPIGSGQRFFNTELEQTTYDPDKAKWYLQQSGLDNSLAIDLSSADAAFGGAVDAAVLYQNSAKAAGIEINVVREPNDGYWSDVWMQKGFVFSYWSGRPTEDLMFTTAYMSGAPWNESFWSNERFDELLVKARAELDSEKRREMYWEMQELCANDGGSVVPMFNDYVFAVDDTVSMPEVLGTNYDLDGSSWMKRWSLT